MSGLFSFLGSSGGQALMQGAAGMFGGLFKRSDPKNYTRNQMWMRQNEDRRWHWNRKLSEKFAQESAGWQMKDIFKTADESGIHRLAALGGASGYQPSGMSVGSDLGPGPGTGESPAFLGDAISDAMNAFVRSEEFKHRKKMDNAELELLKAQSKTLEADARRTETGTSAISREIEGGQSGKIEEGRRTVTDDHIDRNGLLMVHPGYLDAEMAQARRGQIAEEIHGAGNAYHDKRWRNAVNRMRNSVGVEKTRELIEQHINNPEYFIKLSKGVKPKRRKSTGISPHFSK